jgi:broad specificity phosphatase PhoE
VPRVGWLLLLVSLAALPTVRADGPAADGPTTTVILVRHAEKATGSDDPPLTERGLARARELARALSDVELEALYASQYVRTQQTLGPIGSARGLEVKVVPVEGRDLGDYARLFVRRLLQQHSGETVLVAGHSNTVPLLIDALGVSAPPRIGEGDYDDLFVVTVQQGAPSVLLHLHYGAPSGKPATIAAP